MVSRWVNGAIGMMSSFFNLHLIARARRFCSTHVEHNIIKIHNNVMWNWEHSIEYSWIYPKLEGDYVAMEMHLGIVIVVSTCNTLLRKVSQRATKLGGCGLSRRHFLRKTFTRPSCVGSKYWKWDNNPWTSTFNPQRFERTLGFLHIELITLSPVSHYG